jgi:SCY1-like protein 2
MPLIYNAMESEHTIVSFAMDLGEITVITKPFHQQVQEQALKVVPDLCETIDYSEVQGVLFPRVAVSTLFSYHHEVPS